MTQILGYVTSDERVRFNDYALAQGLDVTALANLLIARELHAKRLVRLIGLFDRTAPLPDRAKIVAHTPTAATKLAFATHAAESGVKPSRAAAILFRAELEERWLEQHVLVNQIDSS